MQTWKIVLAVYGAMSAIAFVALALDKRAAERGTRRTRESTLHWFELLGGWPGAMLAMVLVRHKQRKLTYVAVFAFIVLLHAAGWWLALH